MVHQLVLDQIQRLVKGNSLAKAYVNNMITIGTTRTLKASSVRRGGNKVMENIEQFFSVLSKLNYVQIITLPIICLIFFVGPVWLKKKHLKRVGKTIDARIEDRNSSI